MGNSHLFAASLNSLAAVGQRVAFYVGNTVNYTDTLGKIWTPDAGYNQTATTTVYSVVRTMAGTNDSILFSSNRFDNGTASINYVVPVVPGTYTVNLGFCEIFNSASRFCSITVNGIQRSASFQTTPPNTALVFPVTDISPIGGSISILIGTLSGQPNGAIANVEIMPV